VGLKATPPGVGSAPGLARRPRYKGRVISGVRQGGRGGAFCAFAVWLVFGAASEWTERSKFDSNSNS
jgi:hypothetical protein